MTVEIKNEYRLLVSALLLEKDGRQKIFNAVADDYFSDEITRKLYQTFRDIFKKYPAADESAFVAAIDSTCRTPLLEAMNGMTSGIAENSLDDTLGAIREQYVRHRQQQILTDLLLSGDASHIDIRRAADEVQSLTETAASDSGQDYLRHYHDKIKTVPTGFKGLDSILGKGLLAGTLTAVGARPSTGKTTFAINIAAHNPQRKVLFISIEMTAGMIYDRLIADRLSINYAITSRHEVELESVRAVIEKYRNLKIVDNISHVEKIAELIYSEKPELVIIDFVQIITSTKKFVDNRQRIDYISQVLKSTAKATGSCILTLSQITRAGKEKPTMSDLKESGGLEQDSDYVLLLHRPYVNDKSNDEIRPSSTTVTLDKNKFGNTQELKFNFDGNFQRFTELAPEDEIARPKTDEEEISDDLPF